MQIKNTQSQYGAIAKLLHWLVFILVAGLLTAGLIMTEMDFSPQKVQLYGLHKATGVTVFALVLLRLVWKLLNTSPRLPDTLNALQKRAAKAAHWLLYALLLAMPVTGWLMSSAAGFPVSVFGLFTLPNLVQPNEGLMELFEETHELLAYTLMGVVSLHILAALAHHFYFKDNVLRSMLPFVKVGQDSNE